MSYERYLARAELREAKKEASMAKAVTGRARLYLEACLDWSADYEVAARIGDTPPPSNIGVRAVLGKLVGRRLVERVGRNNKYRITDAGRSALSAGKEGK